MRGSGTHHRLRQRVLRLERELDPRAARGPRFENGNLGGFQVSVLDWFTREPSMESFRSRFLAILAYTSSEDIRRAARTDLEVSWRN